MRILHFISAYYPTTGGTVTRVHNLFWQDQNEHALFVPWPGSGGRAGTDSAAAVETIENLTVHRVDAGPPARCIGRLPIVKHKTYARRLVRQAGDERPDVLYGHNPLACALASSYYKAIHRDVPFIYESHGIMRDYSNIGGPKLLSLPGRPLVQRVLGSFERKVLRRADRIIAQTQAAKGRLIELYDLREGALTVIPNGVDSEFFDPERQRLDRSRLREEHRWGEQIVCLYAGYLDEVNGIEFMLESLVDLPARIRRRLRFVLIGRGPREAYVRKAVRSFGGLVEYTGVAKHAEMPGYYSAADVIVIPRPAFRPSETFLPMKLLEAMAMEKVVLVSDVAAMTDVVSHQENGLVFRKGDRSDFLDMLELLTAEWDCVSGLGRRARQDVIETYSWRTSREKLQRVYDELVGRTT